MTYVNTKLLMLTVLLVFGSSSLARAEPNYHDVVRDSNGGIVHSTNGNCVRTKWISDHDACESQRIRQLGSKKIAKKNPHTELTQEQRTVFFKFDKSTLSRKATDQLDTIATILKSDENIKEATIVGFTDRIGSNEYNERLSQRRAETVMKYLIDHGYTKARVTKAGWVGESEPTTNCPTTEDRDQLIKCLHNDRRVEVKITY